MKKKKIRLGVNIDHIATLRQVRGGTTAYPNLIDFMKQAEKAGAEQITIHLREDRRHIQDQDLANVSKKSKVLVNLEMAVTEEMIQKAIEFKPDYICLVPEKRQELTTEGGLDVVKMEAEIQNLVKRVSPYNIKVSTFIEPSLEQIQASKRVGAIAVELHTGKWVTLKGQNEKNEWNRLKASAELAHSLGLQVHAGHGLDFRWTAKITRLPYLEEVNIGHFLVCEALNSGFINSIKKMKKVLKEGRVS